MHRLLLKALGGGCGICTTFKDKSLLKIDVTGRINKNSYSIRIIIMPSQKPRIALTVEHDLNELLQELSVLMKSPKSTIITDILVDVTPMLKDLKEALELAEQKKDIRPALARMTAKANIGTAEMNNDMLNQFDWVNNND